MQTQPHLSDIVDTFFSTASEKLTAAIATTAIVSPIWLPYAHDVAAQWAPVLGCAWLILQIVLKVFDRFTGHREHEEKEP